MTDDTNQTGLGAPGATSGQPEGNEDVRRGVMLYGNKMYPMIMTPPDANSEGVIQSDNTRPIETIEIDDITGPWHLAAPCPADCPTVTVLLAGCEVDIHEGTYPNGDTDEQR